MTTVASFIQAVPWRMKTAERLSDAISRSDLEHSVTMVQKEGEDPWTHFFNVLDAMCASDAEWVIRFEDDAVVAPGSHIKHNCLSWPEAQRDKFGAGWLFSEPTSIIDIIYKERLETYHNNQYLTMCVAVLFRRSTLEKLLPHIRSWANDNPKGYAYDYAISVAVKRAGLGIWRHRPPIVEHDTETKSAFGHLIRSENSTQGAWRPHFKR